MKKHFKYQAVCGSSKDVVNIDFSLYISDVLSEIDGNEQQNTFFKMCGGFDYDNKEQEQFSQNQRIDMEKLLSTAQNGKTIRI